MRFGVMLGGWLLPQVVRFASARPRSTSDWPEPQPLPVKNVQAHADELLIEHDAVIADQRAIIYELKKTGEPTVEAEKALLNLQQIRNRHEAGLVRIAVPIGS